MGDGHFRLMTDVKYSSNFFTLCILQGLGLGPFPAVASSAISTLKISIARYSLAWDGRHLKKLTPDETRIAHLSSQSLHEFTTAEDLVSVHAVLVLLSSSPTLH